ncbi:uncharacterized protein B0I36DRAFT_321861 [Microdochium trichocladiopsis]|uniref:Uncharacterized protein n=1 Tax=Microdochium trichocladiopsis TaxID=1682393 RepID=A0A9P8YAB5_9PEZI|nr:uncharacterized protein B0I36DRAFT_321861 [Microdochium trichocladiopsis]KAH7033665.1 hypothetical protein B0I36DRAFT_321861 [Microdochium trichocladiopsis]
MVSRRAPASRDGNEILDTRGDLWLKTDHHRVCGRDFPARHFLVCPRTVARHSTVLAEILFRDGGRTPSGSETANTSAAVETNPSWVVHLPEAMSTPLKWLLQLMHGQFCQPNAYGKLLMDRYEIVVLADKYSCLKLLQPWANIWALDLDPYRAVAPRVLCRVAWLSYKLGEPKVYSAAIRRLVVRFPADSEELELALASMTLPPSLEDSIYHERLAHITLVLDEIQQCLDELIDINLKPSPYCHLEGGRGSKTIDWDVIDCHAKLLGSLIQILARDKLWPLPKPSGLTDLSLRELGCTVSAMAESSKARRSYNLIKSAHISCAVSFPRLTLDHPDPSPDYASEDSATGTLTSQESRREQADLSDEEYEVHVSLGYFYRLTASEQEYMASQARLFDR